MIGTASISRKIDSAVASGPVLPRALGYEGIQIFGGRMGTQFTTGASGNTFEFVTELMGTVPAQVGSVRAILGTSVAGTTPADIAVAVSAKSLGAIADADASFSTTATLVGGLIATATIVYPQTTSRRNVVSTHEQHDARDQGQGERRRSEVGNSDARVTAPPPDGEGFKRERERDGYHT
jgi:hypothetical protein